MEERGEERREGESRRALTEMLLSLGFSSFRLQIRTNKQYAERGSKVINIDLKSTLFCGAKSEIEMIA